MPIKLALLPNFTSSQVNDDGRCLSASRIQDIRHIAEQAMRANMDVVVVGVQAYDGLQIQNAAFVQIDARVLNQVEALLVALKHVDVSDALLVVGPDMVDIDPKSLVWIASEWHDTYDCLLVRDSDGNPHLQFSIYSPNMIPALEQSISNGCHSMLRALADSTTVEVLAPKWLETALGVSKHAGPEILDQDESQQQMTQSSGFATFHMG